MNWGFLGSGLKIKPSDDPEKKRRLAFERAVVFLSDHGYLVKRMPDGCAYIVHPTTVQKAVENNTATAPWFRPKD